MINGPTEERVEITCLHSRPDSTTYLPKGISIFDQPGNCQAQSQNWTFPVWFLSYSSANVQSFYDIQIADLNHRKSNISVNVGDDALPSDLIPPPQTILDYESRLNKMQSELLKRYQWEQMKATKWWVWPLIVGIITIVIIVVVIIAFIIYMKWTKNRQVRVVSGVGKQLRCLPPSDVTTEFLTLLDRPVAGEEDDTLNSLGNVILHWLKIYLINNNSYVTLLLFILECNHFSDWVLFGPVIASLFTMGRDLLFMTPLGLWYSMMAWLMNCGWHVGQGVLIYDMIYWLILHPKDQVWSVGYDVIQEMAVYTPWLINGHSMDREPDLIDCVWLNLVELDFSWLCRMETGVLQMDLATWIRDFDFDLYNNDRWANDI